MVPLPQIPMVDRMEIVWEFDEENQYIPVLYVQTKLPNSYRTLLYLSEQLASYTLKSGYVCRIKITKGK